MVTTMERKSVARKITPTASKTWKENLRRACLDRARRQRRQQLSTTNNNNESQQQQQQPDDEDCLMSPARRMVEEELRQQAIGIRSPCLHQQEAVDHQMETSLDEPDEQQNGTGDAHSLTAVPIAHHFISEEELFELLEEVEQEMQREQALHVDDILEMAQHEKAYLEEQVIDFEQWEEMHHQHDNTVPCPVCHESNLILSNGAIVCPNTMDGSCSLQLPSDNLSLEHFQDKLRSAFDEHSMHCHHYLTFWMENDGHLRANCSACSGTVQLV